MKRIKIDTSSLILHIATLTHDFIKAMKVPANQQDARLEA